MPMKNSRPTDYKKHTPQHQPSSNPLRFPSLPGITPVTNVSAFLEGAAQALRSQNRQTEIEVIAQAFQSVFLSHRCDELWLSMTDAQRASISAKIFDFLSAVQSTNQISRFWQHYRLLARIFVQSSQSSVRHLEQLLRYFYHQSPTESSFAALLGYMTRDIAIRQRWYHLRKLTSTMVSNFFVYRFSEQSWRVILLVFAHERLFDVFNRVYRDVTQKIVHSVTQLQSLQSGDVHVYHEFVNAIAFVGIYHKGIPRDRYADFLKHVIGFFNKQKINSDSFPVVKHEFFDLSASIQAYISHVLGQINKESHANFDQDASVIQAFERCLRLLARLRCVDVLTTVDDGVPEVILAMLRWPSFSISEAQRFEVTKFKCEAFLSESRATINACGVSTATSVRFRQAWTAIYIGLIEYGLSQLLKVDGSDESLLRFSRHVNFCEDYFSELRPLVEPERWIHYFEQFIEPKTSGFTDGFSDKMSAVNCHDRVRIHALANHFLRHVQAQIDLVLGGLKYGVSSNMVSLRMANFFACVDAIQALDSGVISPQTRTTAETSPGGTIVSNASQECCFWTDLTAPDELASGIEVDMQICEDLTLVNESAYSFSLFHPPPGLSPVTSPSQSFMPSLAKSCSSDEFG